jgi:scyllo-inositol 2-dehydrogenase (NADP+)
MAKRIVVGIASFGMSGRIFHAPILLNHKNFLLKRIVERTKNDVQAVHPGVISTRSLDELLVDDEIELVVVNTPDQTHYELAKKCLEAGKHIIVEKPLTLTIEEGRDLIGLALRKGRMLTVFQNRRWDGDFLTVQDIVRKKIIGRLVDFESHYDRYRNYIQPDTWKEQSAADAGILHNLGSHMIDQALVLFGLPDAVTAQLRIVRTGGEVDDWYDVRLHYKEMIATLKASYLVREPGPRYILHGTDGTFTKYGLDPQEEELKVGKSPGGPGWGSESMEWYGSLITQKDGAPWRGRIETKPGNYGAFYDNVFEHLSQGKELAVKAEEALNVIRIIDVAKKSNQERRTVPLDRLK